MSLAQQGKFDDLSKQLITHILGFEDGEENFIRSEQFVLSNLLYHHCLAVNSHNIRRSIEGLVLKFTVHGQHHRAQQLESLTSRFLASPFFKDHDELDIEWSLLSLLLHLSNSPTQVSVSEEEILTSLNNHSSPIKSHNLAKDDIDWSSYLREGEPEYVVGVDQPLSDWSSEEEEKEGENESEPEGQLQQGSPVKKQSMRPVEVSIQHRPPTTQEFLEQSHRAQSWLAANTHAQYWGIKRYQQCAPVSSHPAANVAKLWESITGADGKQQLCEWAVMREVLWVLMSPAPSHIFLYDNDRGFIINPKVTISSLTAGAAQRLLQGLCIPLNQLLDFNTFLRRCEEASTETPLPVTLQAYATGLRLWRHRFQSHLAHVEECVKKQERTCTLSWLEGELDPWLRKLSAIHGVHAAAGLDDDRTPRHTAVSLISAICDGVETAGEPDIRCVMLRLLLHTLRHYFSIIHNWLLNGTLVDHVQEFIIHRNELVQVYDERFWLDAFMLNPNQNGAEAEKNSLKFLTPLVGALTTVGKSCELLAILDVEPLPDSLTGVSQGNDGVNSDMHLEEVIVRHIQESLYGKKLHQTSDESKGDVEEEQDSSVTKVEQHPVAQPHQVEPLLVAAFTDDTKHHSATSLASGSDTVTNVIEGMTEISQAISVSLLLSSAIDPLIRKKEEEVSARLTYILLDKHQLDRHCQAVRAVLLMEAGDVMRDFTSLIFSKVELGDGIDGISLTLHLQDCIARLYPDLANNFSVSVTTQSAESLNEEADSTKGNAAKENKESSASQTRESQTVPLSKAGLPDISIHYQAPWPVNLLLTEEVLNQYNVLFRFCLSLKRATNGLERLKFRDLASWQAVIGHSSQLEATAGPLRSRLHRLQLLRLWLLCFTRELHDHFANTVFLPFNQAVENLVKSKPSFSILVSDHHKLLSKLITNCLMGSGKTSSPLQIVLNKVFWLSQRLGQLWMRDIGRVSSDELTAIENQYAQVHRYLVNFLTRLTTTKYLPYLDGLTRTLVDTVPLLTNL